MSERYYKSKFKLKAMFAAIPVPHRLAWLQKKITAAMAMRITSIEGFNGYRQKRKAFSLVGPNLPENERCFVCQVPANIRHHIIPLILGGTSKFNNIVPLCHPCHVEVHKVGPREPKEEIDMAAVSRIQDLIREMNAR